jgi:hypothetical protein
MPLPNVTGMMNDLNRKVRNSYWLQNMLIALTLVGWIVSVVWNYANWVSTTRNISDQIRQIQSTLDQSVVRREEYREFQREILDRLDKIDRLLERRNIE